MQKIGAGVVVGLLVVAISFSAPNAAFALRLGPFHVALPFIGHSFAHRHRLAAHPVEAAYHNTDSAGVAGTEPAQGAAGPASALLYPGLALPTIYDEVFWPASSWPSAIGYDAIFDAAFDRAAAGQDRHLCQPDRGSAVIERIGSDIRPNAAQRPLLQKLAGALAMASGFLTKFCPTEIPAQPVARLRLAETQLEALTVALDIIRGPLQDLEQSLNRNQQARLAARLSAPSAGNVNAAAASSCSTAPTTIDQAIDALNQSLQPNDTQRVAMAAAKQSFGAAAKVLDAQCPTTLPPTPSERLKAVQARLDAEWRAVLTIRVALENLESALSDEQRVRLNALDSASALGGQR
jgi:LTXXQ motif family protein